MEQDPNKVAPTNVPTDNKNQPTEAELLTVKNNALEERNKHLGDDLDKEKSKSATLQQTLTSTQSQLAEEKAKNNTLGERCKTLEKSNKLLVENLAEKNAIIAKLQSPATSEKVGESIKHFCIAETVSHDQLCSIQATAAPHVEHFAKNPVTQVLTTSIEQQSAKILALREEVAAIHPALAWAASTFPQVAELSVLNSQLLIINNFNATSICDLEKEIDHAKKLLLDVLDANTRSLIDNNAFNDCVKDQNPQETNSLSQCWLAIRVAELEKTMFEERKLAADEHFFGMLKSSQLEFFDRLEIEEAAVKLDFFNRSCIAALVVHHACSRQEIIHQEEEQHVVLNHDCVFDSTVIEERFACRIMLSHALDSLFLRSVSDEASAHRVIMHEFERAQQRVQVEIDERIARELSIHEEEQTIGQIVEDTHHVGRDILMREESGGLNECMKQFTAQTSELEKFNWFRLACHELKISFPPDFSKEKIIQMLETEGFLPKEEFLEVTDQTLKTCGFPGAIINRLRKVIEHLTSPSSPSIPVVHPLLEEVKSKLPGVLVVSPCDARVDKRKERLLGQGGYGEVYEATIVSQRNRRCAAKIFYDKDIAIQEAKNLFHLDHPNVVRLLGVTVEDTPNPSVVLLFELADCDLMQFIKTGLPVRSVRGFISQIALGLEYLHQIDHVNGKPSIVHLDIKPENILVFRRGSSITLKISDLGFVHEMETSSTGHRTTFAATERYLSPETRIDRRKSRNDTKYKVHVFPAIDIFAFGVILLQIIAPTWYKRHGREHMQAKMDDVLHNDSLLQSNECCIDDFTSEVGDCDDLVKLVKDCLMINRKIRPQNGHELLQRLRPQIGNPNSASNGSDDPYDLILDGDDGGDNSTSDDTKDLAALVRKQKGVASKTVTVNAMDEFS